MYYYKSRAYDPMLGHFLQTDPVGYDDDLNLYAYVRNDPLNAIDPTGREIVVAREDQREQVAEMINANASGTYQFNDDGVLERVGTTSDANRSDHYSSRLDAAISSANQIGIRVAQTYTEVDPVTGTSTQRSVDAERGGGMTVFDSPSSSRVIVSGNANNSLQDPAGGPVRDTPGDILMHELVGHAIPRAVGPETGNAVDNENLVRAEIPGAGQRVREPSHIE